MIEDVLYRILEELRTISRKLGPEPAATPSPASLALVTRIRAEEYRQAELAKGREPAEVVSEVEHLIRLSESDDRRSPA